MDFIKLFNTNKPLIGMIHVDALPGTPNSVLSVKKIIEKAVYEAKLLTECGFNALIIENMHDTPYLNTKVGPEITAALTAVGIAVKQASPLACGIQILAGANKQALAVALAANLDFIRAEGFVFSHIADEGLMNSCAGELLRYRKNIGANHIKIFADIKKKHSAHSITADIDIAQTASAAQFFGADALIVTGKSTGIQTSCEDLVQATLGSSLPILIGSGIAPDNLSRYYNHASGFIVGSYLKHSGVWSNDISPERVKEIISAAQKLN